LWVVWTYRRRLVVVVPRFRIVRVLIMVIIIIGPIPRLSRLWIFGHLDEQGLGPVGVVAVDGGVRHSAQAVRRTSHVA
jgi:hypothetical protein